MSERSGRRDVDAALKPPAAGIGVSIERRRAFRWLLLPAAQWGGPSAWAPASRIASARLWPAQEYTRVIFEARAPIEHQLVVLHDPDRLVLDMARVEASPELAALPSRVQPSDPYVAAIRIGNPSGGFLRVVLDLKSAVRPQVFSLPPVAEYGYRLVVDLYPVVPVDPLMAFLAREQHGDAGAAPKPASPQLPGHAGAQRHAPSGAARHGDRRITIAIDPGHGGEDPGAIGRRGTYEKNVALAISRRLKHVLDPDSRLRVVLTRNADYFVPLAERVHKARRARADLLVSIHADAFSVPTARGSSVFALSEHGATSAAARWMAQRENASDLIGGVDLDVKDPVLARTLLDLSQTAQITDSLKVGRDVLEELGTHNALHKSVVEQAGFAVLKAPDIPSILVETAFISNPDEELKLRDPRQQQRFAESIAEGIQGYFSKSPPLARA